MSKSVKSETQIDEANQELWNSRFGNSETITSEALTILASAEKIQYHKGAAYSKLVVAAGNFLDSKNDSALKYLSEAFKWC